MKRVPVPVFQYRQVIARVIGKISVITLDQINNFVFDL